MTRKTVDTMQIIGFSRTAIEGGVRIISFRKANLWEVKRYEKETVNK